MGLPPNSPLIRFEKLAATFTIYDPMGDEREITASFEADAKLGKSRNIDIVCRGDYPSGQLYFYLASTEGLNSSLLIQELTDEDLSAVNAPALALRELRLAYNYRNDNFSAELDVDGEWEQQNFTLQDLRFAIRGEDGELELQATAEFDLAGTRCELGAQYRSRTTEDGSTAKSWQFLGLAENIPLDKLVADLEDRFQTSADASAALAGLTVDSLEVTFSSETAQDGAAKRDFLFDCKMKYPPAEGEADLLLQIHVNKKSGSDGAGSSSHEIAFTGQLLIGGEKFEVDFATMSKKGADGKETTAQSLSLLAASYSHEPAIDAAALTADLPGIGDLLSGMELKLNEALFATLVDDDRRKYLFALSSDVDLGFDLTTLPLAGELLGGGDFKIEDFRFFLTTDAFFDDEVAIFPEKDRNILALPKPGDDAAKGAADQKTTKVVVLKKGFNFRADMTLGSGSTVIPQPAADTISAEDAADAQPPAAESARADEATPVWLDVNKSFGPVTLARIGAAYYENKIWFLVSASFSAGVLTIALDGLGIGSPIDEFDPSVMISGLSVTYQGGPIELSGGFIANQAMDAFAGEVLVKAELFALAAQGMYGHEGDVDFSSAFIFALVDYPLGGSAEFFVTGLAGGFGYNTRLRIPEVNEIKQFTLIQAALPSSDGTANPLAAVKNDPGQALQKLLPGGGGNVVTLEKGENWLAAGVRFTTYDLINSLALIIVEFGNELEIAVIGLSAISLPPPPAPGADPVEKYAYAELAIEIKILPAQGIIEASAVLTPASFVLDPMCKLTGGFAFSSWFGSSPHAGEFVLTLGGYHPRFPVPAHYPTAPRLGFNWPVADYLTIKGEAYFAMTPSAMMAGGRLQVLFHSGPIRAWLIAQMDALIIWSPFHFELDIAVRIGVRHRRSCFW